MVLFLTLVENPLGKEEPTYTEKWEDVEKKKKEGHGKPPDFGDQSKGVEGGGSDRGGFSKMGDEKENGGNGVV